MPMLRDIGVPKVGWALWQQVRSQIGRLAPAPEHWLVGTAFVLLYLLAERLTLLYELDGLGITLWSPSAGLSLTLLLMRGVKFAPFVFVASLAAETIIYAGPPNLPAMIGTSLVLALGLSVIASTCRRLSDDGLPEATLMDVQTFLVLVPLGSFLLSLMYCGVLYATGPLDGWRFFIAVRNHWIGNTVGMVTLAPVIPILLSYVKRRARPSRIELWNITVFAAVLGAALWVVFGLSGSNEYQFFYLLFLPIAWIAMRAGYAAVAVALLAAHIVLVTIAVRVGYTAFDFLSFQMLMLVLSATGLLLGVVVTERRRSEEKLRLQQSELARAARHATVGAMGTALAHEISQPMASAANYLHAARRILRATGNTDGPLAQALEKSESESQRARVALERVRDYVSMGRIEPSQIDVEALVTKIAGILGRDADARGISISNTAQPHLPQVQADPVQIELLLVNLVSNAIDAASSREDHAGVVMIHLSQAGDRILLDVADNGPGIADNVADRVFEPFETTKSTGMGLGLTLARQIAEAHGGNLSWKEREPQGVSFRAVLPIGGPLKHGT
jgi:signal transduction histidine kinase